MKSKSESRSEGNSKDNGNVNSNSNGNSDYKFVHYPGASDGFAVRGDESDVVVQKAKEDAFQQALAFFTRHSPRQQQQEQQEYI